MPATSTTWTPSFPDTPSMKEALEKISILGEYLESIGYGKLRATTGDTEDGHAIHWLGLRLQEMVDDGVFDDEYDAWVTTQEDPR